MLMDMIERDRGIKVFSKIVFSIIAVQIRFCPEPHIISMLNDHHVVEVAAGDCHSMALNVFGSVR